MGGKRLKAPLPEVSPAALFPLTVLEIKKKKHKQSRRFGSFFSRYRKRPAEVSVSLFLQEVWLCQSFYVLPVQATPEQKQAINWETEQKKVGFLSNYC